MEQDAILTTTRDAVKVLSINDAPFNRMSLAFMDALDMILRAKKISGPEALRIGLVNEVWPLEELKNRAIALAQELAAMPRDAVRAMMGVIIGGEEKSLTDLIAAEQAAGAENRGSADSREGMQAFLEKRKPVFNQG